MKKNVIAWSDSSGALFWRLRIPFGAINTHTDWTCHVSRMAMNEQEILNADVIVLHNIVDKDGIATALAARYENPTKRIIIDVDDALFVNKDNPHAKDWEVLDASYVISQTIQQADAVTCTTETLKDELLKLNKNIHILPNSFDDTWLIPGEVTPHEGIRIGWAGSITHMADFTFIQPVIDEIMRKYPVKFIICGDPRFKDMLEYKERIEIMPPVPIEYWPKRLASMQLDIGIAPLADNLFNTYKSNIKWMEYSSLSIPSVCSEIVYKGSAQLTASTHDQWLIYLSELIENKEMREKLGKSERNKIQQFNINSTYQKWLEAYES